MSAPVTPQLNEGRYGAWHTYWLIWFGVVFLTFIAPEVYALATDWRRTLSAAVWHLESFTPHQVISQWSAVHLLFVGAFGVLAFWLFFHFAMGWWR